MASMYSLRGVAGVVADITDERSSSMIVRLECVPFAPCLKPACSTSRGSSRQGQNLIRPSDPEAILYAGKFAGQYGRGALQCQASFVSRTGLSSQSYKLSF